MFETPQRIRAILTAEAGVLEDYLMGSLVYRQVRVEDEGQFVQHLMSLGDFLEHRAVWKVLTTQQLEVYAQVDTTLAKAGESQLRTFADRAAQLAQREIKARLDGLRWNLESWTDEGHLSPTLFATEMAQRSRIQRLGETFSWSAANGVLQEVDARIQRMTGKGDFIWNLAYADAFPPDAYWFLYRKVS